MANVLQPTATTPAVLNPGVAIPPSRPEAPPRAQRFRTIDGLRGIAALSVVIFHLNVAISRSAPNWLPAWLSSVVKQGGMGVDIFFVISGFVIAYSVRDGDYSARYLGRFALRRSIRLDPLYWFAIFLELGLIVVSAALFPGTAPFPPLRTILAHFVYAQDLLGYGDILAVFWTLTFEIQFYLFFVGLLVAWKRWHGLIPLSSRRYVVATALAALFVISLVLRFSTWHLPIPGVALLRWFQFFLGVLTWWALSHRTSVVPLIAAYCGIGGALIVYHASPLQLLPVVVSAFILTVGSCQALDRVLSNRPIQFLGAISYSLYLLHGPVAERWVALLERVIGSRFGVAWGWLAFVTGAAIAIGVAALAWRFIEAPTMRLSRRIRLPVVRPGAHAGASRAELSPS